MGRELVATADHPLFAKDGWKRMGELASQLSACAADLERFLAAEADQLQALHRHLDEHAEGSQRHFHPGSLLSNHASLAYTSAFISGQQENNKAIQRLKSIG